MKVININSELNILIEQSIQNSRVAQKRLYEKYAPKLLSICRQYITDIYNAEDVMVASFMKIFTHLHTFEQRGNFEAWIRRIAVNESISFIRTRKQIIYGEEILEIECKNTSVENKLITDDIQNMIDLLPEGCKMVFILFAVEGYKHHEISDMLHINEGTSKSQVAYARKLLQQMLESDKITSHG